MGMGPRPKRGRQTPAWLKANVSTSTLVEDDPDPDQASLVEQEEKKGRTTEKKQSKRELTRVPTETLVHRSLRDNFKGWSQVDIDGLKVEGLTLRERLTRDKRQQREDATFAMGGPYYKSIKLLYMSSSDPRKQLLVSNGNEELEPKLVIALTEARKQNPNRHPLLDWLRVSGTCNQRSLVGLLRFTLDIRAGVSIVQATLLIDIMKYLVVNGMDTAFPAEIKLVVMHFDDGLCHVLASMRRERLSIRTFFELSRVQCRLVLPMAETERAFAAKGSWTDISDDLNIIVASSRLGAKLFGFALESIIAEKVEGVIQNGLAALQEQKLTIDVVTEAKKKISTELKAIKNVDKLSPKWLVSVRYRGIVCQVEVGSIDEELIFRFDSVLKERAVETEAVLALHCENVLVDFTKKDKATLGVDDDLVRGVAVARQVANDLLASFGKISGSMVAEALLSKQAMLCSLDRSFNLEISFFNAMAGSGGETRLHAQILKTLPRAEAFKTLAETLELLKDVANSDLYIFVSKASQGSLNVTKEIIEVMSGGRPPNVAGLQGVPFLRQVAEKLPMYLTYEHPGSSATPAKRIWGKDALDALYTSLLHRKESGELIDFDVLQPFHVYSWLMTDEKKEEVNKMTKELLSNLEHGSVLLVDEGSPKKKRKTAKKKNDGAGVMSLFE